MSASDNLQFKQFVPPDDDWTFRMAPQSIDSAIDSYPARVRDQGAGESAPYNAESLAEIYHPRVKRLLDLQAEGHTHAAWGRLNVTEENTWFGMPADAPELKNPAKNPNEARKRQARYRN